MDSKKYSTYHNRGFLLHRHQVTSRVTQMEKLIIFLLCSLFFVTTYMNNTTANDTYTITREECFKLMPNMTFHKQLLREHSKPDRRPGYYILDWAACVVPKKASVCPDKVIAYYNPPKDAKNCCAGWKVTEPKYPNKPDHLDTKPFHLKICKSFPINPHLRKVSVQIFLSGSRAVLNLHLNDDLWNCTPSTTTTTTITTTATTITNTTTTSSNGSGSSYLESITFIICFIIAMIF